MKRLIVCIPTRKRQKELKRLLVSLTKQGNLPNDYAFEILIINNDRANYVENVIGQIEDTPFVIHTIHVRQRGFANVRNAAVSWVLQRDMDGLIFVDDDEIVPINWLHNMVRAWDKYKGDIITGPVTPIIPLSASHFAKIFGLLEPRDRAASGKKLRFATTNNTMVSRKVLDALGPTFHPTFNYSGGEDTSYFHQAYLKGFSIYWDNSIETKEVMPPNRGTTYYVLYRRFNHGMNKIAQRRLLYPDQWLRKSFKHILDLGAHTSLSFAVSVLTLDKKKFGRNLLWFSFLAGSIMRLLGIIPANRIYR